MTKIINAVVFIWLGVTAAFAQEAPRRHQFTIESSFNIDMRDEAGLWNPSLAARKLPKPHPGADKATIERVKSELMKYRENRHPANGVRVSVADTLVMLRNFLGNNFNGYVPNDNDMAISNHDEVCSVTNTTIFTRDQVNGVNYGSFALHNITVGAGLQQEEFDPKVLYDPQADRFIMVCLNGFTDSTSNILVGFTQDSSSYGSWQFYALPGNPLNNSLWTDFPMIAVNDDYLFITVNLLYNDSTWQAGFNESLIWQINKSEGYTATTLNPVLHSNITYNGQPLRNLCPVKGGSGNYGPDFYFLSNRNFAASNDTVFLITLPAGAAAVPVVQPVVATVGYHMPADADQPFVDKLAVNDARFLGAFYENGMIQGVCSTLDTTSGLDGIYHVRMDNLTGPPVAVGYIYTSPGLDLAYPNIAYAGTGPFNNAAVISVLKSSPSVYPGCGAVYFDNNGDYSPVKSVKEGQGYTNLLVGMERWGDYTGCQTRFNMPGMVWMNGSYSIVNHQTRTWIAELVPAAISSSVTLPDSPDGLDVYPNPTADEVTVAFNLESDGLVVMELFDVNGKLLKVLYRGHITSGSNTFSFSAAPLPPGNYVIRVLNGNNVIVGSKQFLRN